MLSGYTIFLSTAAGLLGTTALSRRGQSSATTRVAKKGSFLLKTPGVKSEAARVVAEKKGTQQQSSAVQSKNERLGKSLIAMRDTQMGPNVSVFYKQVQCTDLECVYRVLPLLIG